MSRVAQSARWRPVAVALLAAAVISPVLWSGWIADDAFYSALNGVLGADRITLAQAMAHSFGIWFFGNGRFYPLLVFEKYAVFATFSNLPAYKLLLVCATLLTLELFRRCVRAYAGGEFATVAALAAAALFLVHGYQDALIAYNAMPQMVAIALLGSLMAFRAAVVRNSTPMAALSCALYLAATLTYEDAYVLCALYPLLARALGCDWRRALRAGLPQVAIAVALAGFELWLHARAHLAPDALYALRFGPGALSTALYQTIAPLPLVYWIAAPPREFAGIGIAEALAGAALFAAFAMTAIRALRSQMRAPVRCAPWAAGLLVAILPALPMALLVKYQQELRPGLGYLPSFFQTFGLALLAAGVSRKLGERFGDRAVVGLGALFGLVGAAAFAGNIALVRADQPERAARAAFQNQLAAGLIAPVPDGVTLTIPRLFDWVAYDNSGPDGISTRGLLYTYARRRADLAPPLDPRARFALSFNASANRWSMRTKPVRAAGKNSTACNAGAIVNGEFMEGLRCWAPVPAAAAVIGAEGACFPADLAGKPFASLRAAPGRDTYLAQSFVYNGSPERIELRAWSEENVMVTVGIVFPVGSGIGTERILGTFSPPQIVSKSGSCTGRKPMLRRYAFSGYGRGDRIQLRLHAVAGTSSGEARFDGISSRP